MKSVKITYTTKPEYAAQNQRNIQTVMSDLQQLAHQGINYSACLSADNKTFVHSAFFKSDNDEKILNNLPSFKSFQEQLKASGPETPPKLEVLTLVGSSAPMFES